MPSQGQTTPPSACRKADGGRNLISEVDYLAAKMADDTARAQVEVIDAQITSAELSVEKAELDLSRTEITAPMDGTVVALPVEVGQTINASCILPDHPQAR